MLSPFNHQSECFKIAMRQNLGIFHDCGTGKTITALMIANQFKKNMIGPALVVATENIIEDAWLNDADYFPGLRLINCMDRNPSKRLAKLQSEYDIALINHGQYKSNFRDIVRRNFQLMFVDESSCMKDATTDITKSLLAMAGMRIRGSKFKSPRIIPHRYAMSGTPAPNDEGEYWGQFRFVVGPRPDILTNNFYTFRRAFFKQNKVGGKEWWEFRSAEAQRILEAIKPHCHVVTKDDALDLPPQKHLKRTVVMNKAEAKAYAEMSNDSAIFTQGRLLPWMVQKAKEKRIGMEVLGDNVLTKCMKLRQITSGFAYGEDLDETRMVAEFLGKKGKPSKLMGLLCLLDEIKGNQVIIWANFDYEIDGITKALRQRYPQAGTEQLWGKSTDGPGIIRRFKAKEFRYLVANYSAKVASHGITFTNCNYAVYYSMNFSYEQMKQSRDRIHRAGQTSTCWYYYLLARDTYDLDIFDVVEHKRKRADSNMAYLKG